MRRRLPAAVANSAAQLGRTDSDLLVRIPKRATACFDVFPVVVAVFLGHLTQVYGVVWYSCNGFHNSLTVLTNDDSGLKGEICADRQRY